MISAVTFSQSSNSYGKWMISVGANIVNNDGDKDPFDTFDINRHAFSSPFFGSIDYRLDSRWSVGVKASLNQWKAPDGVIDNLYVGGDVDYFSADVGLKYYFIKKYSDKLDNSRFDMFFDLGAGSFKIEDESAMSANIGLGFNYWFSNTIGIHTNMMTKWSDENKHLGLTNHFHISAGLAFRFGEGTSSSSGCSNDIDNDGIKNKDDDCPSTFGIAEFNGCPDGDGDGIPDKEDNCPKLAGIPSLNGCPEKVPGELGIEGTRLKEANDELKNSNDRLRNSITEIKGANNDMKMAAELLIYTRSINYNSDYSVYTKASQYIVDEIRELLNKNSSLMFVIEGHTDNAGSDEYNQKLSEGRAETFKQYLVDNGLPADNFMTVGYGESKPISANEDAEGRAKNRRIEISISK